MEKAKLILEYLRVILSAQIVVGAIIATFLVLFRSEISSLLSRVASIKWGRAELSAPQPPSETSSRNESVPPGEIADQQPPPLPADMDLSSEDRHRLEQAFLAERARAHLWEYRYLNYFLVPNTQRVLDWLASLPNSPTFTMYDAWWQFVIPSAEQRRIIVNVLEGHNLIFFTGELLEVTPKGREYIQWRGPAVLPAPTPEPGPERTLSKG